MTDSEPQEGRADSRAVQDRSWLTRPPVPATAVRVARWREEVDAAHQAGLLGIDAELPGLEPHWLQPGISVVVLASEHPAGLTRCLSSLANQTLDPTQFEVIVVLPGDAGRAAVALDDARRAYPLVTFRAVRLHGAGGARAAGVVAAWRTYATIVHGTDHVSAPFLEVLLAHATARLVPVAPVVDDEQAGGPGQAAEPDRPVASEVAWLAPTGVLQAVASEPGLAGQEADVFCSAVLVRGRLRCQPCPTADGAVYHRYAGPGLLAGTEPTFETRVARALDGAEWLEQLADPADVDTRRQLQDRLGVRADRIGELLRQQPGGHGRVVAALDHRPLFRFPYHRMNGDRAECLAISYAFPPYADASATVAAKRVRARGDLVDVVYNAMDRICDLDDTLRRISGPYVGWEAVLPTPSYFSDWGSMEAFTLAGLDVLDEWVARKGPYRQVYSRAQFAASHFLAAAYKLRHPDVRWSAEFSDPLSRGVTGQERGTAVRPGGLLTELRQGLQAAGLSTPDSTNCFVWCEQLAYLLADELVFTNSHQRDYMLGYCLDPEVVELARAKAVISPHPTLPAEFYSMVDHAYPLDSGVAHLAYFGNFYATRGLDDVLTALARTDPVTRARLRLHVFTNKPAGLDQRAAELGVAEQVRVGPYVRYLEFLNLTTRFDCLIVNDATTSASHGINPYLPSKWSDYRGSGAPVWGLIEPESELSRQPVDYSSPVGDVDAACKVLSLLVAHAAGSGQG